MKYKRIFTLVLLMLVLPISTSAFMVAADDPSPGNYGDFGKDTSDDASHNLEWIFDVQYPGHIIFDPSSDGNSIYKMFLYLYSNEGQGVIPLLGGWGLANERVHLEFSAALYMMTQTYKWSRWDYDYIPYGSPSYSWQLPPYNMFQSSPTDMQWTGTTESRTHSWTISATFAPQDNIFSTHSDLVTGGQLSLSYSYSLQTTTHEPIPGSTNVIVSDQGHQWRKFATMDSDPRTEVLDKVLYPIAIQNSIANEQTSSSCSFSGSYMYCTRAIGVKFMIQAYWQVYSCSGAYCNFYTWDSKTYHLGDGDYEGDHGTALSHVLYLAR